MAMVNIPSTNDDPAYRYKMPRLISKKEGRGNGSKTCIVNMGDVARALKRPPQYTTKWFGNELGAMSTYTNLASQGERCIINGHHDTQVFQEHLDNFIAKYVCCQNCKLPEIDMRVKKGLIVGVCLACGWQGNLDNNHKLAVFIVKNPPDESGHNIVVPGDDKKGLDKRARRAQKLARSKAEKNSNDGGSCESGEDEGSQEEEKEKKKKKKEKKKKDSDGEDEEKEKKKKKKKKKEGADSGDEDEGKEKKKKKKKEKKAKDDDDSDSEAEAAKKKKKKKEKKEKDEKKEKKEKKKKKEAKESESESQHSSDDEDAKSAGGDDEVKDLEYDDPELKSVIEVLKEFVKAAGGKPKTDDFVEEARMHQLAKCFDNKIRLYVVFEALCGSTMDAKSMASQKKYINKIINSANLTTDEVLWTINVYYKVNIDSLKALPMVLKCAYDEEWLQEDELRAYFEDGKGAGEPGFEMGKKYSAPFLKWLATAGSDDSSSDDESD